MIIFLYRIFWRMSGETTKQIAHLQFEGKSTLSMSLPCKFQKFAKGYSLKGHLYNKDYTDYKDSNAMCYVYFSLFVLFIRWDKMAILWYL